MPDEIRREALTCQYGFLICQFSAMRYIVADNKKLVGLQRFTMHVTR